MKESLAQLLTKWNTIKDEHYSQMAHDIENKIIRCLSEASDGDILILLDIQFLQEKTNNAVFRQALKRIFIKNS